jgi:hypothetical protein
MINSDVFKSDGLSWTEDPDELEDELDEDYIKQCRANSLVAWCRELEEEQDAVHRLNLRHYQFYSNRYLTSFDWGDNRFVSASLEPVSTTTDNIVIQVVDSLLAEIGKSRPKAKPILFGASWKKHKMAKRLDKFLYGEFIRTDAYEEAKSAMLNAFICGFGCIKVDMDGESKNARVCLKSVFPDDIIIDNTEFTATGEVFTVAHRQVVPLKMLRATYDIPDEVLERASIASGSYSSYRKVGSKWVVLVRGIRKACDGVPGREVLAIPGYTIEDKAYEHDWLPYVFYHWGRPNKTFYTQSVVEQALPNQLRIIDINQVIHRCQEIVSRPRLLVQQGSSVNPLEINNLNAKILMYKGVAPVPLEWRAASQELYNEREREIKICFDKFGLNQYTAGGGLPDAARLDSSAAVREYTGIQNSRLSDPVQRYENFFLAIARTIVRVLKASGANPKTTWYSGGKRAKAETIRWKDIDIDDDAYTLILEAASSFSMTPSAMRDTLEDHLAKGLITPEEYRYQLGATDLDTLNAIKSAGYEDTLRVIELLEDGKFEHPMQEQDLVNGTKLVQLRLLCLNNYEDDEDTDKQELDTIKLNFIQWLVEAREILREGTEAEAPDTQASNPMAAGMTMPVPTMQPNAASLVQ